MKLLKACVECGKPVSEEGKTCGRRCSSIKRERVKLEGRREALFASTASDAVPSKVTTHTPIQHRIRIYSKADPKTGCWEWQRAKKNGYGRLYVEGVPTVEAHRLSYRWRFVCRTCQTRTPLASLEQAELARDRHLWELHQEQKDEQEEDV